MVTVEVTQAEVAGGSLTTEHRAEAVEAILRDGFVVLKDIIDMEHIAVLREKMLEDVARFVNRKDAPFNFNKGNVQQDPPPFPPYLFKDVLVNDLVIEVTKAILGKGVKNDFYSGNTAVRSEEIQPTHVDVGHLWAGGVATPPFGIVVNVPVVDMSPENGSTLIWTGTHLLTTKSVQDENIKVSEADLEARRAVVPPIQPTVSAGSVLLRDIRLWHAGMPNRTDTPRPMIAMIHWSHWFNAAGKLKFPKGTEALFSPSDLYTIAEFVDEEIDYIAQPHAYDYKEEPKEGG